MKKGIIETQMFYMEIPDFNRTPTTIRYREWCKKYDIVPLSDERRGLCTFSNTYLNKSKYMIQIPECNTRAFVTEAEFKSINKGSGINRKGPLINNYSDGHTEVKLLKENKDETDCYDYNISYSGYQHFLDYITDEDENEYNTSKALLNHGYTQIKIYSETLEYYDIIEEILNES